MKKENTIMKKVLAMLMAALMVAAMFTGCSSSKPATETTAAAAAATAGTVKIGMSGPLTGGASAYGLAVKAGMEVAVEEINAKGGLQIEFNAQDDEADGEKAVSAYNVLKDWGMQVMAGPGYHRFRSGRSSRVHCRQHVQPDPLRLR